MKKIFKICTITFIISLLFSFSAFGAANKGTCGAENGGKNLTWTFSDGTLTISGNGKMKDYQSYEETPWYQFNNYELVINIESGVTSIGNHAFESCFYISGIAIPDTVESIGDYAFSDISNYPSYKEFPLPDSVKSIGDYAFYKNGFIKTMTLPKSLETIGAHAFEGMKVWENCVLPESLKSMGEYAFADCFGIKSIDIPGAVQQIPDRAFYHCVNLTAVNVSEGIVSIGAYAFSEDNLRDLTLPSTLKSIGDGAFRMGVGITELVIPENVTEIGANAFEKNGGIKSVSLPQSLISIGDGAFDDCNCVKSFTVDGSNNVYSSDRDGVLFNKDKTELLIYPKASEKTNYNIPESVTSIAKKAFEYSKNLSEITIPYGVETIDDYVFSACENLVSADLPQSVTSIGKSAFAGCVKLKSVNLPQSLTKIGQSAFSFCASLKSINFPQSVTSIDSLAFKNAGLTSVSVPQGVTVIQSYTFRANKDLSYAIIPSSVTKIGNSAFGECDNLKDIYFAGTQEQWNSAISAYDENVGTYQNIAVHFCAPVLYAYANTSDSGQTEYVINAENVPGSCIIIAALYDGGKFAGFVQALYNGQTLTIKTDIPHDSVKIMAWASLESAKPVSLFANA